MQLLHVATQVSRAVNVVNPSGTLAVSQSTPGIYSYTIPSDVNQLTIKAWGAGGISESVNSEGGAGGFAQGTIPVTAGQVYTIVVGSSSGGGAGGQPTGTTYGGDNGRGSNGGGYSGVFLNSRSQGNAQVIAGGGGSGAAFQYTGYSGGAGGGTSGGNGLGITIATGGTQTSGVDTLTGGAGANWSGDGHGGGGGGSGYYGGEGGGGTAFWSGRGGDGGAGGSGFVIGTATNTQLLQGVQITGYYPNNTPASTPNQLDPDYLSGVGGSDEPGLVVLIIH